MAISCYFSKSDWHSPHYWSPDAPPVDRHPNYDTRANPEQWARFVDFVHRQIEELMTGYGPIDVLWLDGGQVQPPNQDIQMDTIAGMARSHQPGLIIADRTVGGEHENFLTPEQLVPDESMHVPWETCMTLGNSWKYIPDDDYKSPVTVIRTLADIISKGGNFLLGIGPDSMGRFPGPAVACLREVGKWMKVNGEAIYDTQPIEPQASGSVRFTSRESDVYAIVLPDEEREAPAARVRVAGIAPAPGSELQLVGTPVAVPWTPTQDGFVIDLGNTVVEPAPAWVLRFSI
jgi:alpha-L-fucosidase